MGGYVGLDAPGEVLCHLFLELFDIQGLGGVFIDRIEGCFYNVVGLPLAKLVKMLKVVGVDIF